MFRQKRLSQTLLIVLLMGLTIASLWGLTIWKTVNDRQIALAQSGAEAQNLAHSLGQHAAKTFSAVGIVLLGTKQYLQIARRLRQKCSTSTRCRSPRPRWYLEIFIL